MSSASLQFTLSGDGEVKEGDCSRSVDVDNHHRQSGVRDGNGEHLSLRAADKGIFNRNPEILA